MTEPNLAARPRWTRNLLIRVVLFPTVGATAVLATLVIFENRLVYFPTTVAENWIEPADLVHQDVALKLAGGTPVHAWWCPREGATDALLYCHGNGGNLSFREEQYRQLRDGLNVSVMAVDYPGYGKSGGKPSEAGCYEAAQAAFDWVTANGVRAERIILFGESLGGGVAADLATRRPCRALVLYSTFSSAPDVGSDQYPFLPTQLLMRNRFETKNKLAGITRPVFIAHGDADRIIPVAHARRLESIAVGPKELLIEPGRGHETDITPTILAKLREFLRQNAP